MGSKRRKYEHKRNSKGGTQEADPNAEILMPIATEAGSKTTTEPLKRKMSRKKKKRLEAYIQKKLKKEERITLFEKLSKSTFHSELMKSSRTLGNAKETMRERLKRALCEERAGLPASDPSVRLVVEREVAPEAEFEMLDAEASSGESEIDREGAGAVHKVEIVMADHRLANPPAPLFNPFDFTYRKENVCSELVKKSPSADVPSIAPATTVVVGSALKKLSNEVMDTPSGLAAGVTLPPLRKRKKKTPRMQMSKVEVVLKKPQQLETNTGKVAGEHTKDKTKAYYVNVQRKAEIQKARMELPVCAEEQKIVDTIRNNLVIILCGETGSGKTTQVPQFLYEAGYGHSQSGNPGMIGCTQPRRVAAVSMAKRVAEELNVSSKVVSYQIRYDGNVSDSTAIKFMTDGVLMQELSSDLLLSKYSVLIIDEAHERSLNTDIIIGVASRVVKLREKMHQEAVVTANAKPGSPILGPGPLRVVIMSATLRVQDFTENRRLFEKPPPVLRIEARQYPVTVHFSRKTPLEQGAYMDEVLKKVSRIHKRLPDGGILVFLTGQLEIASLCKKLRRLFPSKPVDGAGRHPKRRKKSFAVEDDLSDAGDVDARNASLETEEVHMGQEEALEDVANENSAAAEMKRVLNEDRSCTGDGEGDNDVFDDLDESDEDEDLEDNAGSKPLHVLPLYSLLSTEHQLRVFKPPPAGTRLCVVATNVAETSLTIPGIKYVCDCGRVKERTYDVETGVQSYKVVWVSKAAADQRAGRAGRTGPGHCYRLYSSAVYDQRFSQFTDPEIMRMPVDGVVLQMKAMNIDNVCNFPFPTPPEPDALLNAERLLCYIGALERGSAKGAKSGITELGKTMSLFPLAPRFAKMLVIGQQHGCLPHIIAIVSALSVGDPFHGEGVLGESDAADDEGDAAGYEDAEQCRKFQMRRKLLRARATFAGQNPTSDLLRLLNVVGAFEFTPEHRRDAFCEHNFLRLKAMLEIRKLRGQLTKIVQMLCPAVDVVLDPKMKPPSESQIKVIRQIIAAGYLDQIAVRRDLSTNPPTPLPSWEASKGIPYDTMWSDEPAYIHPTSVLYDLTRTGKAAAAPPMVSYQEVIRSATSNRMWLKGVTSVHPKWMAKLGSPLCILSRPAQNPSIFRMQAILAAKRAATKTMTKKSGVDGGESRTYG